MAGRTRANGLTLLVDVSSLAYRAYFAVPDDIRAADGSPVNAAYGFLSSLARLVGGLRPRFAACALDDDWRPEWRVELLPEYKAHRVAAAADETGEEIERQIELIGRILGLAGIAVAGVAGYEAEDVIGTLAARARGPVAIVSGDRDLFQLVRDPDVWVLYPQRGVANPVRIDEAEIARRYAIPGRLYADFAILRGDPSDGLPGVAGVGAKTAAALVSAHGTVEAILAAARGARSGPLAKVAAAHDYVERAARVVRITGEAPAGDLDLRLPTHEPDPALEGLARESGLQGPVRRLLDALGG